VDPEPRVTGLDLTQCFPEAKLRPALEVRNPAEPLGIDERQPLRSVPENFLKPTNFRPPEVY